MLRILLCIFMFAIHYLESLWKYFEEPIVFLTIRQCNKEEPSSSINNIRSFLFEQYEKFVVLFFNQSKKQEECHLYKINLHFPILIFILKCSSLFYCLIFLRKILVGFYERQCYYILQKQIEPFVHIRSVALISKQNSK
jgi:hypothetical protein